MTEESSAAAADPLLGAEEARREKLKKAGEAYFEKILAGQRERDPPLPASKPAGGPRAEGAVVPFDDTFHTVGAVVESALVKQYVLGTVYVACQAAGLVFAKASLDALAAPAILVFLHLLPLVCAVFLLSVQGAVDLRPFSGAAVQGAVPSAVLTGVQVLCLFFSLLHTSVSVVLCWVTVVPHLVQAVLDVRLNRAGVLPARRAALAVGVMATAAALSFSDWPGMAGAAALLLWAAAEAVSLTWALCRQRPQLLVQLFGEPRGEVLQRSVEAEQSVDGATLTFMRHALPALPILVIGLALGEGKELVDHELSVPAATMILLSVAAYGLGCIAMLLIADGLARAAHAALGAAGPLGTVVVEAAVHGVGSPLVFAGAVVAAVAGLVLRMAAVAAAP